MFIGATLGADCFGGDCEPKLRGENAAYDCGEGVRPMANRIIWWVVALIFGGVLTAGTGGPGVVFLTFVFVIGITAVRLMLE
jgi:hypothetical protein